MISVTILVKNGERTLAQVLDALVVFDEVLVYDTGSSDKTSLIASRYPNVRQVMRPFKGFGAAHNEAAALAKHPWILSIDADEVLSPQLVSEIMGLTLRPDTVYSLPFLNYYNTKQIKWCGWYPEKHIRLYNKTCTCFSESMVHEGVIQEGQKVVTLQFPVHHYPYSCISDFLIKMERYSTLFAEQYKAKRKSSPLTAIVHGGAAFFKSFVLKKGFMGGFEGFLISAYNGHTAFYKYLKLYQANKT